MGKKQNIIQKVKKIVKNTKVKAKANIAIKKEKPKAVSKKVENKVVLASRKKTPKLPLKSQKIKVIAKKTTKPEKKALKNKLTKPLIPVKVKKITTKEKTKKASKADKASDKKTVDKNTGKAEKKALKKLEQLKALKITKVPKIEKVAKKEKKDKKDKFQDEDNFSFSDEIKKPAKKSKGGRKPKKKNEDDDEPIVENDLLIEQLINSTKRLKKPPKTPKQLRTFTNPMTSLTVAKLIDSNKKNTLVPKKEPKGKFELEYVMHTSPGILYEFLTSPSGLSEWFADDVNIHEGIFTFFWEGSKQKAKLLSFKEDKHVRLQWLDKPDGTYFEFRIERDELTGDISLMVTDFADEAADLKTSKLLWDSQINQLIHVIGSY